MNLFAGILLCSLMGASAIGLKMIVPLGAVTISLILGIIIANTTNVIRFTAKGIAFSEKKILASAIALLGFSLDYHNLFSLGIFPLILILTGVPFTIIAALFWGRVMKVEQKLALLIGTGNGICGSSAIAAAQGVIQAKKESVGLAVAIINLLGSAGILIIPAIFTFLPEMADPLKGMIIGNILQAVGQVTAAGFSMGNITGQTAVLIKMGRIILISPMVLIYGFFMKRNGHEKNVSTPNNPVIPSFIILFIFFSLINTIVIIPPKVIEIINEIQKILLTTAMAGIGMNISFTNLRNQGKDALILGVLTWISQIGFSFLLINIFQKMF